MSLGFRILVIGIYLCFEICDLVFILLHHYTKDQLFGADSNLP